MQIESMVFLAQRYADMGDAVQRQLSDVMAGRPLGDQNPNALKIIRAFLERAVRYDVDGAQELVEQIDEFLAQ